MQKYTYQTEQRITHYVDEPNGKQYQHLQTDLDNEKENSELLETVAQMHATIQKMSAENCGLTLLSLFIPDL